jgi:hypothetical protein
MRHDCSESERRELLLLGRTPLELLLPTVGEAEKGRCLALPVALNISSAVDAMCLALSLREHQAQPHLWSA